MTPEQINISEIIQRYRIWLLNGIYATIYYRNEKEWRDEVNQKISELEVKLKHDKKGNT